MEYVSGVIKKETKEISELVKPELVGQTVKVYEKEKVFFSVSMRRER